MGNRLQMVVLEAANLFFLYINSKNFPANQPAHCKFETNWLCISALCHFGSVFCITFLDFLEEDCFETVRYNFSIIRGGKEICSALFVITLVPYFCFFIHSLITQSASCVPGYLFGFTLVYFSFYALALGFVGIVGIIVVGKAVYIRYLKKSMSERLELLWQKHLYGDFDSIKKFYKKNKLDLRLIKLQKVELRVFRDQFEFEYLAETGIHESCCICLEDFETGDKVVRFPICGHLFNYECLEVWLKKKKTCPYCVRKFRESFIMGIEQKMKGELVKLA